MGPTGRIRRDSEPPLHTQPSQRDAAQREEMTRRDAEEGRFGELDAPVGSTPFKLREPLNLHVYRHWSRCHGAANTRAPPVTQPEAEILGEKQHLRV
jgi:hypothetical protein